MCKKLSEYAKELVEHYARYFYEPPHYRLAKDVLEVTPFVHWHPSNCIVADDPGVLAILVADYLSKHSDLIPDDIEVLDTPTPWQMAQAGNQTPITTEDKVDSRATVSTGSTKLPIVAIADFYRYQGDYAPDSDFHRLVIAGSKFDALLEYAEQLTEICIAHSSADLKLPEIVKECREITGEQERGRHYPAGPFEETDEPDAGLE